MRHFRALLAAITLSGFVACGSDDETPPVFNVSGSDAGIEPQTDQGIDAPIGACQPGECCVEKALPDHRVRILLRTLSCTVERGRSVHFDIGLEIPNDITIDENVPAPDSFRGGALSSSLTSAAYDSPSQVMGLEVAGATKADHYCYCDVGLGPNNGSSTRLVKATSHFYPFTWSGHTYYGPSDTGQGEGGLFGFGPASLNIVFAIDKDAVLEVSLPFTITGDAGLTEDAGLTGDAGP